MEDEFSSSCSWISTKALREAADIKFSIKTSVHRKSASEIPTPTKIPALQNLGSSASVAQTPKNNANWNLSSIENTINHKSFNFDLFSPDKKYAQQILRLNEEIQILSEQLKLANLTIKTLTEKLADANSKHVLHLQALQERHEQKLKRNQKEIEVILQSTYSLNSLETQKLTEEFHAALEKQQSDFDLHLDMLERRYLEEAEKKEAEYREKENTLRQNLTAVVFKLKEKFAEDLEEVKKKYKEKLTLLLSMNSKVAGRNNKMS